MRLFKLLSIASIVLAPMAVHAADGSWDGQWVGSWGGKSPLSVRIKDDKVISYTYRGASQSVGPTKLSGGKLSFGSGYTVTLTKMKNGSASGFYKGNGTATATLVKK